MSKCVFLRSVCVSLALSFNFGVSGIVGSCTRSEKINVDRNEKTSHFNKNSLKNQKRNFNSKINLSKCDLVEGKSCVSFSVSEKVEGNVSPDESDIGNKGNSELSKEDKDKIIKVLLGKLFTESEQQRMNEVKSDNKKRKLKDDLVGLFHKAGGVAALCYSICGSYYLMNGDVSVKDFFTTVNSILSVTAFGAIAIEKF